MVAGWSNPSFFYLEERRAEMDTYSVDSQGVVISEWEKEQNQKMG
jgi:hypothetical protein